MSFFLFSNNLCLKYYFVYKGPSWWGPTGSSRFMSCLLPLKTKTTKNLARYVSTLTPDLLAVSRAPHLPSSVQVESRAFCLFRAPQHYVLSVLPLTLLSLLITVHLHHYHPGVSSQNLWSGLMKWPHSNHLSNLFLPMQLGARGIFSKQKS